MRVILLALLLIIPLSMNANAQTQTFTREGVEYVLDLPSPSWRAVSRLDVHEHLEFVNGQDYSNGYLRLRKKLGTPDTTTKELFSEAEKWELHKLPGYVVCSGGKGTDFNGQLKGTVFSYEFVNHGRNMDGRIYYLRVDNHTFYILHFTVASEKLPSLLDQMDSIARSFRLK
ncbi:MAG TPA: hypothetical protein VHS05_08620 [Pyrinomonadaceae bacterium]|jgi:hypothetical protein|nr:hypothetical protein [Pyrinomonadaceae bacterium]